MASTSRRIVWACVGGAAVALWATDSASGWEADPETVRQWESRAPGFLFREEQVPAYRLPPIWETPPDRDVAAAWEARRSVLRGLFEQHVYGRSAPAPERLTVERTAQETIDLGGGAVRTRLRVTAFWGARSFAFSCLVVAPAGEPRPIFVLIHNRRRDLIDPPDGRYEAFWPVDLLVARGYAAAAFQHEDVAPDSRDRFREGVLAATLPAGPRADDAPGALAAWAWGASRVLDAVAHERLADASRAAVIGHSRGGKAALWAGACDARFGLAIANDSGCGGAALSRRGFGETVAAIAVRFPHWFCPRLAGYAGRESELPVDQHQLVALLAPRAAYVASADGDLWADPRGEWLGLAHAAPAYAALGLGALATTDIMPGPGVAVRRGPTGYHLRAGEHDLTRYDWQQYLDMADRPETWSRAAPAGGR